MKAPEIDIDFRLMLLLEKHGEALYSAPPTGTVCDCTDSEHFHVRCMKAECDECGDSFQQDFMAYTGMHGLALLAKYAREHGWYVDLWKNYFCCPECLKESSGDEKPQ